jgi:hypothetical protein
VRKAISIVVSTLLAVVIVSASVEWAAGSSPKPLRVVRGVIGSENKAFFADPRVEAAFAKQGIDVHVDTAGSGPIAATVDGPRYDFAFTSDTSAVGQIVAARHIAASYVPFFTPMVVATFTDIAQLLERAGVAHDHGGWWTLDMKGYLDLVAHHVRWNQLPGNITDRATNLVLITSTDITTTNSAAMYASIVSDVANKNRVLDSPASVDAVVNRVSPVFVEQHHSEQSTAALFDNYLSTGEATTPMVMISEAQFVAHAAALDGRIRPNMVLMYPVPDVLSKSTLVPLSAAGDTIGRLLTGDPTLDQLAVEHGFRITSKPTALDSFAQQNKLAPVEPQPLDVIEPPTFDILKALMTRIDAALYVTLGPGAGPSMSSEVLNLSAPTAGRSRSRGR